jgi:hypothetical protein
MHAWSLDPADVINSLDILYICILDDAGAMLAAIYNEQQGTTAAWMLDRRIDTDKDSNGPPAAIDVCHHACTS